MRQWWDNETTSQNPAHVFGPSPHKNEIFFPWFPRFRDPGSPEDNCLMLVEVDSRESNSDSLLFVVEMMSQIHVLGNSAVLRKWATPSNSMYHLQCQLCIWESQLWDEGLHVGCAGFIGLQAPFNRSTCQLHMLTMCAYDSTMPPGNSTSILKMKLLEKVFPASVSNIYIYISSGWIFFFNPSGQNWSELDHLLNGNKKYSKRSPKVNQLTCGHLSPFPIISALVPRYTPSSPWPCFQRGWLPGSLELLPYSGFYGEIQESDGKFKHQT